MIRILLVSATTLALAACGSADAPKQAEATPAKLPAGTYEVTATVKTLGCVGKDGLPAPELLAAKGDSCSLQNPYVRNGRMNVTLDCQRKGQGQVMAMLDGKYGADNFSGTLNSSSSFVGPGDYKLVEEITARKISDQCTAAPATAPAKA
jgi:hypothetical protein